MTDHPIIFSAPMILALLAGRKTMTRRLAKRRVNTGCDDDRPAYAPSPWQRVQPGAKLWVRESAAFVHDEDTREATKVEGFAADGFKIEPALVDFNVRFRPSIHMPRWASRLTLIVTATKIERLQEITNADVRAEGIPQAMIDKWGKWLHPNDCPGMAFGEIWDALHGDGAWDENPEVVALSFTVHKQNIDALAEAA